MLHSLLVLLSRQRLVSFLTKCFVSCCLHCRGPAGDLYVSLDVRDIPDIERDGINLRSSISISYINAILGSIEKVITVEGLMDLQVPAGTQPGDILVMHKLGMPKLNKPSSRGDHFFTIKVTIPIQLRYEVFVKLLYKTISAKHMEP
jgi:DnaJ-class molecular chaperone